MADIIAYRGVITGTSKATLLDGFIERLQERGEITTADVVKNMSIAYFKADNIEDSLTVRDSITGIGNGSITLINAQKIKDLGGKITKDPQPNFANHALLSDIDVKKVFDLLNSSGVHFTLP